MCPERKNLIMAGKEKNCRWYFADQPKGQEVGSYNAMEQSFKSHPYASLLRESIKIGHNSKQVEFDHFSMFGSK